MSKFGFRKWSLSPPFYTLKKLKLQKLGNLIYSHRGVCDPADSSNSKAYTSHFLYNQEVETQRQRLHQFTGWKSKTCTRFSLIPSLLSPLWPKSWTKWWKNRIFSPLFPLSSLPHLPCPTTSPHQSSLKEEVRSQNKARRAGAGEHESQELKYEGRRQNEGPS